MPSNPKKGKTSAIKCTENLKEFYENEDEFKFSEGKLQFGIFREPFYLDMHLVQKRFFDLKNNAISTDMIFKADLS